MALYISLPNVAAYSQDLRGKHWDCKYLNSGILW